MYQREFDKVLRSKKIPKSLMFFGESHFLIDRYLEKVKSMISADDIFTFYDFDYNLESAKSSISQGSLFSETTLLVIKSEQKISNKDLKILIDSLKNSDSSYFLYLYYGDNFKDVQKSFLPKEKGVNFVRFFNPNFVDIQNIIYNEAKERDIQISQDGINQLIYLQNSNISLILGEITKIANYGKKNLNKEDILNIVSPSGDIELDRIINFYFNSKNFSKLIQFIDLKNIDEVMTISYMVKFVEELYLFRSAFERGENSDALSVLGRKLPPHVEQEKQENWRRFSLHQIEKILILLMKAELKFKSGKVGDKTSFFSQMLISISRI